MWLQCTTTFYTWWYNAEHKYLLTEQTQLLFEIQYRLSWYNNDNNNSNNKKNCTDWCVQRDTNCTHVLAYCHGLMRAAKGMDKESLFFETRRKTLYNIFLQQYDIDQLIREWM